MDKIRLLKWTHGCIFALALFVFFLSVVEKTNVFISFFSCVILIVTIVSFYHLVRLEKMFCVLLKTGRETVKNDRMVTTLEEENRDLSLQLHQMEIASLHGQIAPHFLYNTLDSIRSRALLANESEIARMTELLSVFFRYCISNYENLVKVKEELHHIQNYYEIQRFRFSDRIHMSVEVENDEINELYIPRMTLQPIIENSMVHGLEKVKRKGKVEVHLCSTDRDLIITVSDNGVGMSAEELEKLNTELANAYRPEEKNGKHRGIAVRNINARLKLLFGEKYGLHYRSILNEGTDVVVTLPCVDDFHRARYEEDIV